MTTIENQIENFVIKPLLMIVALTTAAVSCSSITYLLSAVEKGFWCDGLAGCVWVWCMGGVMGCGVYY